MTKQQKLEKIAQFLKIFIRILQKSLTKVERGKFIEKSLKFASFGGPRLVDLASTPKKFLRALMYMN